MTFTLTFFLSVMLDLPEYDQVPVMEARQRTDVLDLKFIPGKDRFISSQEHGTGVWLWGTDGEPIVALADGAVPTDVSSDGRFVVTGDFYGWIRLYETDKGKKIREWKSPEGSIASVAISSNGEFIAASQGGVKAEEEDLALPLEKYSLWLFKSDSQKLCGELSKLVNPVVALDIDRETKTLACGFASYHGFAIWSRKVGSFVKLPDDDILDRAEPPVFRLSYERRVQFSGDSTKLLVSGSVYLAKDWSEIWAAYPRLRVIRNSLKDGCSSSVISRDGKLVCYGSGHGNAYVWDIEADRCIWAAQVRKNKGHVLAIAISDDNRFLLTGGRNSTPPWDGVDSGERSDDPYIRMWKLPKIDAEK